uniref:Uncharacterized protein n=1 Tax=Arundo donax TaxID=35708 RepID=A0A0A8Z5P6_ARUDO
MGCLFDFQILFVMVYGGPPHNCTHAS